jgi:hypothetical protein
MRQELNFWRVFWWISSIKALKEREGYFIKRNNRRVGKTLRAWIRIPPSKPRTQTQCTLHHQILFNFISRAVLEKVSDTEMCNVPVDVSRYCRFWFNSHWKFNWKYINLLYKLSYICPLLFDRLSGLVVRVPGYRSSGLGFDSPVLLDFLRSSGSGTGYTQPRENNWGTTWMEE